MLPEEIKALRAELGISAKQLADALGTDQKTIFAWETGELFPTKRHVQRMEKLRRAGALSLPPQAQTSVLSQFNASSGSGDTLTSLKNAPAVSVENESAGSTQREGRRPPGMEPSSNRLTDPRLWAIVKRLVDDPDFFQEVARLSNERSR